LHKVYYPGERAYGGAGAGRDDTCMFQLGGGMEHVGNSGDSIGKPYEYYIVFVQINTTFGYFFSIVAEVFSGKPGGDRSTGSTESLVILVKFPARDTK
jgi:hypothetical protein